MKIRLGDLRKIIREAIGGPDVLAAAVRAHEDQASAVVYSPSALLSALRTEPFDMGSVVRGYIQISKPDEIQTSKPDEIQTSKPNKTCNGAWEVHSAWGPGIGEMIYDLGFALSPTGILMPDRLGVLPRAVARWEKQSGRKMKALDNHKHPPKGTDPFHDKHHTEDPSDDCRMNKDGFDFLNYSYEAQGGEKGMLKSMVTRHEEAMAGVSSPEDVEEALFDSARSKFREAVKSEDTIR